MKGSLLNTLMYSLPIEEISSTITLNGIISETIAMCMRQLNDYNRIGADGFGSASIYNNYISRTSVERFANHSASSWMCHEQDETSAKRLQQLECVVMRKFSFFHGCTWA